MTHLGTLNISYGPKKGRESNCQFDSQPLKVDNRLDFLACRWRATYRYKAIDKGYNFALDITSIGGLAHHVMRLQSCKSPNFSRLQLGSPGTK
jgi:hypothetical protein